MNILKGLGFIKPKDWSSGTKRCSRCKSMMIDTGRFWVCSNESCEWTIRKKVIIGNRVV